MEKHHQGRRIPQSSLGNWCLCVNKTAQVFRKLPREERTGAVEHPVKRQRGAGGALALVAWRTVIEKKTPGRCLPLRKVGLQAAASAGTALHYLVTENITCPAPYYLCSALKSGTLINYYSKVLIKHQSKAGLLGWGLP